MSWADLERRRRAMAASASGETIWQMEGQTMDLNHCLMQTRNAIADHKADEAVPLCREVRDRITQLLKECDVLDERVKLDQLLSKCPEE